MHSCRNYYYGRNGRSSSLRCCDCPPSALPTHIPVDYPTSQLIRLDDSSDDVHIWICASVCVCVLCVARNGLCPNPFYFFFRLHTALRCSSLDTPWYRPQKTDVHRTACPTATSVGGRRFDKNEREKTKDNICKHPSYI